MAKITRKGLIKKIDHLVTQILLKKERSCVTCGSTKQLGAGHIFSRKHLATRFDIEDRGNVHIQCWNCNYKHVYDTYPYNRWYVKKFGEKDFDNLYDRWNQVTKIKQFQLEIMREELEKVLETIEKGHR